jgi:hypothetical protein
MHQRGSIIKVISITMRLRRFAVRDGFAEGRSPNCAFAKA